MPYANYEDHLAQGKRWRKANPDKVRQIRARSNARPTTKLQKQKWVKENPEKVYAARTKWNRKNREYWRKRQQRLRQDPVYKLLCSCRSRIRHALFSRFTKTGQTSVLLGCSTFKFRQYIEALFLPGMSWANRSLWHIDHKKPISSFDLSTEEGQRAAFHYTNCQPLWAIDNLRKGAKVA